MLKLNRWNTWNFTFKKRASATAPFDSLNGVHIFFTIKREKDLVADDAGAIYEADYLVSTAVTSYTFTVAPADTDIAPGIYTYGFRWIQSGVEKTADCNFEVLPTTTNRRA